MDCRRCRSERTKREHQNISFRPANDRSLRNFMFYTYLPSRLPPFPSRPFPIHPLPRPFHYSPLPPFGLIFQDILLQAERNRAVTQTRVFDFKTRLFQYVYITSTTSSEKHLEGNTGELSSYFHNQINGIWLGVSAESLREALHPTEYEARTHLGERGGRSSLVWSCAVMVLGSRSPRGNGHS